MARVWLGCQGLVVEAAEEAVVAADSVDEVEEAGVAGLGTRVLRRK